MTARGTRIVIVEDHEVFGVGLEKCLADFEWSATPPQSTKRSP